MCCSEVLRGKDDKSPILLVSGCVLADDDLNMEVPAGLDGNGHFDEKCLFSFRIGPLRPSTARDWAANK